MVQKEVADRIVSPAWQPGLRYPQRDPAEPLPAKVALKVAPGSFQPPPRVASSVLLFEPLEEPLLAEEELGGFIELVKNVFQQRRKTLQNTLRAFYSLSSEQLEAVSESAEVDLGARPEALSKEEFHRLARSLAKESKR